MEISESDQETDTPRSAKKSRRIRIRNEVRPASAACLDESEISNSDDSEDDWSDSQKKKSKRNKKTVPKQTLKQKLSEKTRKLQQLCKPNSVSKLQDGCEAKRGDLTPISSIDNEERETQAAIATTENTLSESNFDTSAVIAAVEDTKPLIDKVVKCDTSVVVKNVKLESLLSGVAVKNETVITKREKNCSVREPIVIEYSINRSQVLDTNASPATYTPSNCDSSQTISRKNSIFTNDTEHHKIPTNRALDELANVSRAAVDSRDRREKNSPIVKFSSNANFQTSIRNQTPNNPPSVTSANRSRTSKSKSSSVPFRQTPDVRSRRISPITRSNHVRIVKNLKTNDDSSSTGSKKMYQNLRHEFANEPVKNNNSTLFASRIDPSSNRNSVLNKLNNISPNGTVIHTGTGSVTITPRKIISEKPPTQRKLFKNEIEGTITARNMAGTLRYVVNLANGTFIPLSDLQINKLREQNRGVLPIKLKIPVPSDVADKIEPSFIIED